MAFGCAFSNKGFEVSETPTPLAFSKRIRRTPPLRWYIGKWKNMRNRSLKIKKFSPVEALIKVFDEDML